MTPETYLEAKTAATAAEIHLAHYRRAEAQAQTMRQLAESFEHQVKILDGLGQQSAGQLLRLEAQQQTAQNRAGDLEACALEHLEAAEVANAHAASKLTGNHPSASEK